MNPAIHHREAEYQAKEHLRQEFTSHRTSIDRYETPDLSDYDSQVYELAYNVGGYILKSKGEQDFRNYINTSNIDW